MPGRFLLRPGLPLWLFCLLRPFDTCLLLSLPLRVFFRPLPFFLLPFRLAGLLFLLLIRQHRFPSQSLSLEPQNGSNVTIGTGGEVVTGRGGGTVLGAGQAYK